MPLPHRKLFARAMIAAAAAACEGRGTWRTLHYLKDDGDIGWLFLFWKWTRISAMTSGAICPTDALYHYSCLFSRSQKVDLTVRIREILSHYPPGISVLKEFVQNADDAGARVLRMCVDKRQHSTSALPAETLAPFQGPSLLVFNDAVFSDRDFESICNIGNSVKKLEVAKTGRFGLGFNAVYHLTDLPSFASRNRIVFFDPHAQYYPSLAAPC
jgi:hypothetical protein